MPLDPEDTAEVEDMPPLDDAGVDAKASTEQPADAGSSPAEPDASKTADADTLSIVRDAVDKKGEADAAASSAKSEEAGQEPGDPNTKPSDEFADVPFNKHPRFQEVLTKLKTAEADAVRYRNVEAFLQREGLTGEDAASGLNHIAQAHKRGLGINDMALGLDIMAQSLTDPDGAFERLRPWLETLVVASGRVLPQDLAEKVRNGAMPQEAAFEVSRARAQLQSREAATSFEQQRAQAEQQRTAQQALHDAATAWETDRAAKDPNFASKKSAIVAEVQKLQALGWKPTDPEGVREQLRRAYAAVNGSIRNPAPAAPAPARPAVAPIRSGGHVAATNVPQKAPSTLEYIQQKVAARA